MLYLIDTDKANDDSRINIHLLKGKYTKMGNKLQDGIGPP